MTSRVPSYICKTAINQTLTFLMSRPLRVFRAHLISIFLWCTFAAALHLLLRPKTWLLFCYVLLKEIPYFACLRPTSSGGISFQKGEIKHQQFWPSKSYFCREEAYFAFLEDFPSHFSRSARLFCSWKMKSLTSEISLEKQRSIAAAAAGLYIFYHLKCIDMMSESWEKATLARITFEIC